MKEALGIIKVHAFFGNAPRHARVVGLRKILLIRVDPERLVASVLDA